MALNKTRRGRGKKHMRKSKRKGGMKGILVREKQEGRTKKNVKFAADLPPQRPKYGRTRSRTKQMKEE